MEVAIDIKPELVIPDGLIVREGFVVHDLHLVMLDILKQQLGIK